MLVRPNFVTVIVAVGAILVAPGALDAQEADLTCTIVGTDGSDVLVGTDAADVVCGRGGDDLLVGGDGDDVLLGGDGDDELIGSAGNDVLVGGNGNDRAFGGPGHDSVRGEGGEDSLVGGPGRDVLRGGDGDDSLAGGDGADTLWGGPGDDLVRGSRGPDLLYGGPGDDVIRGGSGVDRLRGGPSSDVCIDPAPATNGINCEFGVGGDADPLAVAEAVWGFSGSEEFVYAVSGPAPCGDGFCQDPSFVDVVHVRGEQASSEFGTRARTASELFVAAAVAVSEGHDVSFDSALGLPRSIGNTDGSALIVENVSLRDDLRDAHRAAKQRWEDFAATTYSFTVSTKCSCPESVPLRVTVDGTDVASSPLDGRDGEWSGGAITINAHLENLGQLLDGHVIGLEVVFDPISGVPASVAVDRDPSIHGEEYTVVISDLVVALDDETDAPDVPLSPAEGEHPADDVMPVLEIVVVEGIEVSSVIAEDLQRLINAARADGLTLSGGGFRDPQRQIDLRRSNCGTTDFAIFEMPADQCSPPTARPGQSQHELGLAVDFTSTGRLITTRSDPAFIWLDANAHAFGFLNLPSEPWHWSTTGN